jgi:UDP-glucose 4-epimerase
VKFTVTGGTGFIGLAVAQKLITEGHEVIIADVREPREESLKSSFKYCDVTDAFQVQEVVRDRDIVIHLAANADPGIAEKNPRFDLKLNVYGTLNVADSCKCFGKRLVFSSTAATIYSPLSCYAISKRTAEMYILHAVDQGLNASIVKFWNVYGPTQELGLVIPDLIEKLKKDSNTIRIRGTGLDLRDFVYIDDVVNAVSLVALKGLSGQIYEVGFGKQITIVDLARLIGRVMNGRIPEVIPAKQPKAGLTTELPENLEPLFALGWKPKCDLETGIKEILKHKVKV